MNTYFLKINEFDKDFILKYSCEDYFEACEYFSSIKQLSQKQLLEIYVVVTGN
jgi:hypothetical protein